MSPRVVIAGGGISGLALAWALRGRGVEALLLESGPRAGGKIKTDLDGGFLCEAGPASFQPRGPAVSKLVHALGLEARTVPASPAARRRCVVARGALRPVPTSPGAFLVSPLLPPLSKLRALGDLVLPRGPAARGEEESVAAFARRRFGWDAAERLVYPLISGIYAGDPERLSLPSSFPALAALERDHRSLLLGLRRAGIAAGGLVSFQGGMEDLPRALAERLGESIRLSASVRRVERTESGFRLAVEDADGVHQLRAGAVALAVPAHAAAPMVEAMDPTLGAVLAAIPYAPVTLVHAAWRASALARQPDAYGFLVPPSESARLLGAVFASVVFPDHAPAGTVLVSARIGGTRAPALAALPDAELVELAHAALAPLLGASERPVFTRIVRHERALPQYTLGHRWRLAAIDAAERRHPGLFLTGNAYRGLGISDCIAGADPLADRMAQFVRAARTLGGTVAGRPRPSWEEVTGA